MNKYIIFLGIVFSVHKMLVSAESWHCKYIIPVVPWYIEKINHDNIQLHPVSPIMKVDCYPDNTMVTIAGKTVYISDTQTGELKNKFIHDQLVSHAYLSENKLITTTFMGSCINIWNVGTQSEKLQRIDLGELKNNLLSIYIKDNIITSISSDGMAQIWNLNNHKMKVQKIIDLPGIPTVYSNGPEIVAIYGNKVHHVNMDNRKVKKFKYKNNNITSASINHNAFAVVQKDKICVRNLATDTRQTIELETTNNIETHLSNDRLVAIVDKEVYVINLDNNDYDVFDHNGHVEIASHIIAAKCNENTLVTAANNKKIYLWDIAAGQLLKIIVCRCLINSLFFYDETLFVVDENNIYAFQELD